jgi:tetratricopeptide (TPR) repeat protein
MGVLISFFPRGYRFMKEHRAPDACFLRAVYAAYAAFLVQNLVDFSFFVSQAVLTVAALMGLFFLKLRCSNSIAFPRSSLTKRSLLRQRLATVVLVILAGYSALLYAAQWSDAQAGNASGRNNFDTALAFSKKSCGLSPLSARYFFHAATLAEMLSRQDTVSLPSKNQYLYQAIDFYKEAIKRNRHVSLYYYRLGNALLSVPDQAGYEEAGRNFQKAVFWYPLNPFYHEQLARFYGIVNQPQLAEEQQSSADELRPYYVEGAR